MSRSKEKFQRWMELITFLSGRRGAVSWEEIARGVSRYGDRWESGDPTRQASVRRMFERDKESLRALGIPLETVHLEGEPASRNPARRRTAGADPKVDGGDGVARGRAYRLREEEFFLPYLRLAMEASGGRPPLPEPSPEGAPMGEAERRLRERLARPALPSGTVALTADEAAVALEALAVVEGIPGFPLSRDARSALARIRGELGLPDPTLPILFLERPGSAAVREQVERLAGWVLERRVARFRYRGMGRDTLETRTVHPLGLIHQWGWWYLVAWDPGAGGFRQFRVGRMSELRVAHPSASPPEFDVPTDFRLEGWLRRPAWALGGEGDGDPVAVQVRFPHPHGRWAHRNGLGELVAEEPDGSQMRRFRVYEAGPFLRWVLGLGGRGEVVEPPEIREAVADLARAVIRAHAPSETDG